jgi:hypothetical protein
MKTYKLFFSLNIFLMLLNITFATVPDPVTRQPAIPYLMEPIGFRTMQMAIFAPEVSGMVPDKFSDLSWNPAYILREKQKTFYIDFNLENSVTSSLNPLSSGILTDSYYLAPSWYSQTSVQDINIAPLYNLALILPLNKRMSLGIVNRSVFDYGPYRNSIWWTSGGWFDKAIESNSNIRYADFEPQRLETDENQQTVIANQSEITLGYRLSTKTDLGLHLGHYIFHRDGYLLDSQWATHPHSSYGILNDEDLEINGCHYDLGAGFLYHPDEKTTYGISVGAFFGSGQESEIAQDTSDSFSETATNTAYYCLSEHTLNTDLTYKTSGVKPYLTLILEKKLNKNLVLRSSFSLTSKNQDVNTRYATDDTTFSDRTYDHWITDTTYAFRRYTANSAAEFNLNGSGEESINQWKFMTALIYSLENDWAFFGGVQISRKWSQVDFDERSNYYSNSFTEYSLYNASTYRNLDTYTKKYSYSQETKAWNLSVPIGVKAYLTKGFSVLLGTDINLTLYKENSYSDLLYPNIVSKYWINDALANDDPETNRYERYDSNPPKTLTRTNAVRFGMVYEHSSGAKLFIRSDGDIMNTNGWTLGFEMNW